MNRNYLYALWAIVLLVGGFSSCTERDIPQASAEQPVSGGVEIVFSVSPGGGIDTRTSVVTPDNNLHGTQHVTRVHLYLYDGDGSFLHSEEVEWYKDDSLGVGTKKKSHKLQYADIKPDGRYTLLAVGLDDVWDGQENKFKGVNSVKAYDLPDAIKDKSLSEAKAELVKGQKLNRGNIAESELFAGYVERTGKELTEDKVTVELYRRVAGVSFAFKNIPQTVKSTDDVVYLAIRICGSQNKSVSLIPRLPDGMTNPSEVSDEEYVDYEKDPLNTRDGDILYRTCLRPEAYAGGGGGGGGKDYEDKEDNDPINVESVEHFVDPLYGGRYVLPAKFDDSCYDNSSNDENHSTLTLELWDKDKNVLLKRPIVVRNTIPSTSTRSGTGIIGDGNWRYRYPLRANHFYRIGTEGDPVDLSGKETDVVIMIDDVWDEYYGGAIDGNGTDGTGIDHTWGEHEGGSLVTE